MTMNDHDRAADDVSTEPHILPMVGSTMPPRSPRARAGLSLDRLTEVVRGTVEQLRSRLDRLGDELRETDPVRIASILDADRLRCAAADIDGIARTLVQLGDLLAPDSPSARWVSPRGVLEATLAKIQHEAAERPLPRIDLDVAEGHAVHADPLLMRRVLETLLLNAIEAAGPTGEVVVTSVEYADAIEIEVADSGGGLSPPARAWLFEPGFTTKSGGAGLGLAAASSIVDQLGGTIDAVNCPDGGSAFTVRLPHGRRRRLAA
jgi:signal transduction histidine kinase